MGIFGKIFGKKEDSLGFDEPLPGSDPLVSDDLGMNEKPIMPSDGELPQHLSEPMMPDMPTEQQTTRPQTNSQGTPPRDLELINSKLDTLKAILNSMDQRIANLERAAGVEQKKMPW